NTGALGRSTNRAVSLVDVACALTSRTDSSTAVSASNTEAPPTSTGDTLSFTSVAGMLTLVAASVPAEWDTFTAAMVSSNRAMGTITADAATRVGRESLLPASTE